MAKQSTRQLGWVSGFVLGLGGGAALGLALNDWLIGALCGIGLFLVFGLTLSRAYR